MAVITHSSTFLLLNDEPNPALNNVLVVSQYERLSNFAPRLWTKAPIHIAADGGANRLYDEMPLFFPTEDPDLIRRRFKPDYILGNMNSIRPEVRAYYANLGTQVIDQPSDELVDLHQCVDYIKTVLKISKLRILVIGAQGGRFDQFMGNFNVLYHFSHTRIVLISHESIALLLQKSHHHVINILPEVEGPTYGLIPIGAPSRMTNTSGLVFNLGGRGMAFGGLISTSNLVIESEAKTDEYPVVTVDSDADLIWTIKLKTLFSEEIISTCM